MRRMVLISLVTAGAVGLLPSPASAAKPALSVKDAAVSESAASVVVKFKLSGKAKRKVKATWSTADGSAQAGSDYVPGAGTIKIRPGERKAKAEIPLSSDGSDEDAEAFAVRLDSVKRAKIGTGTAEVTIEDDDPPPSLSASPSVVPEGDTATQDGVVEVSLSAPSSRTVEAGYSMTPGTAATEIDFDAASGSITIPAGETTAEIGVQVVGDTLDEADETFSVVLSAPVNATLGESSAAVTIADDDPAPAISLTTTSVPEGTSGTYERELTATLSAPSGRPVSAEWATASGTALASADFTAGSGVLSFAPGDTAETFEVITIGDYDDEADETFTILFSETINVIGPPTPPSVTIADDDDPCVSPSAAASALDLGDVPGDVNAASIQQLDSISPCGDSDWFRFSLTEQNSNSVDLHAAVTLQASPNDSPASGDLDLCVQLTAVSAPTCSTQAATDERVDICVDDDMFGDDSTDFLIEVDGFGLAVNTYTLEITGNTTVGTPILSDC
jgi:hypothetical protein